MATHRIPIMGPNTLPDATGECFMDNINNQMALATLLARNLVMTMLDPTAADIGFYGSFQVPQNYSATGTTKIVIVGILDGTVGATTLAFEFSYVSLADGESAEAGWDDSDAFEVTSLSGSGYADEEMLEALGTITQGDFAAGEEVMYYFKRDYSDDSFVGDFHVLGLYFEYTD